MTKYRIRIHTSVSYRGYFWNIERRVQLAPEVYGWERSGRGGYAFTRWGARMAANHKVRAYSNYIPYEEIKEL